VARPPRVPDRPDARPARRVTGIGDRGSGGARVELTAVESTLKRVERNERTHRLAILSGAILEAVFLGAFLLTADFSNRTHLLLLMVCAASLSLLVLAAMALGAFVNRHTCAC
jgi:hypothetical protein